MDTVRERRKMLAALKEADPMLGEDDKAFHAAMILLASAMVGPNVRRVAAFTGYSVAEVSRVGRLLRKNAIWVGRKIAADWWDEETGGIGFWCDVNVALGRMERRTAEAAQ